MKKYEKCQKFNQGFATTEYLAASYLDLAWHSNNRKIIDINKFEKKLFKSLKNPTKLIVDMEVLISITSFLEHSSVITVICGQRF